MSTEDDLRHMGQAAAALVGVAAARAKQVAEQLLGNRDKEREDVKRRGGFVEEGRHAAADVVGALRRETSVILHDLEHLEQSLRAREGGAGPATTTTSGAATVVTSGPAGPEPAAHTPATATGAGPSGTTPTAKATTGAPTGKPAAKAAKADATKDATKAAAPRAKAAGARKAASPRKPTGGADRPSSEGQG
jgi:hypothetical protein